MIDVYGWQKKQKTRTRRCAELHKKAKDRYVHSRAAQRKQKVAIKVVSKICNYMIAVYTAAQLNAKSDGQWSKRHLS